MKIIEMLSDAVKYPFSGIKQLLLLGLMILTTVSILQYYNPFYTYLYSTFGDNSLKLVILLILVAIILLFFEAGYAFRIIEKSIMCIEEAPRLNNFTNMFKHGINETILILIYFSVPFIILFYALDYTFSGIKLGMLAVSVEVAVLLIIVAFVLGFILDMIFTVAMPHMAFKGGSFKEAFRFHEIFRIIKKIGLKKLFTGYIIVILGIVIIGGPLLIGILGKSNIIGFVIAEELIAPYIIMLDSRFIALLYRES